jgi:hypothetical protein
VTIVEIPFPLLFIRGREERELYVCKWKAKGKERGKLGKRKRALSVIFFRRIIK